MDSYDHILLTSMGCLHSSDGSTAEKLHFLCSDPRTRAMRAVQERQFLVVPFAATNLGVRLGALAYNFAEAMAALARGTALSGLQFTRAASELTSVSGAKIWDTLPMFEETDLDTFCPGQSKPFVIVG